MPPSRLTRAARLTPAFEPLFKPKVPGFQKVPLNDLAAVAAAITEGTVGVMVEAIQAACPQLSPGRLHYGRGNEDSGGVSCASRT